MKRYLFVIPLAIVAAALLSFNCGQVTTTGPGVAGGNYMGQEACEQCHSTAHEKWEETAHATTFVDDPDNPYDFFSIWVADGKPESCLQCHTTGWDTTKDNHGADEAAYRKSLLGIQCEQCHGPGSEHVAGGGDPTKITVNYGADLCGSCHTGEHHPTYDEWQTSKHAAALDDLKGSSHAADYCLKCHSADYWYDRDITLDAAEYGITCVMCHSAHGSNFEHQLLADGPELCGQCHTDDNAQPGSTPHHPQDEMLSGYGGYEWPQGGHYSSDEHTYVIDERCITCHMYSKDYEQGSPAITGHSWEPEIKVCQGCHTGANNFNIGGAQTDIDNLLTQLKAKLDQQQNENDPDYLNAKFDYDFVNNDKSKGVHNYAYGRKLLQDSIDNYTPSDKGAWLFRVASR